MFHGLIPADIFKQYRTWKDLDSGKVVPQTCFNEVKSMVVDSRVKKYNPRNPTSRAVEKRVAECRDRSPLCEAS